MHELVPAIMAKFPASENDILVQQDNVGLYIKATDPSWHAEVEDAANGWKIKRVCQPQNSPDLNVNDLGFFNAVQAMQQRKKAKTEKELMERVFAAYEAYTPEQLNRIWINQQSVMREILICIGNSSYEIPHLNKSKLEAEGGLPLVLSTTSEIFNDSKTYLGNH